MALKVWIRLALEVRSARARDSANPLCVSGLGLSARDSRQAQCPRLEQRRLSPARVWRRTSLMRGCVEGHENKSPTARSTPAERGAGIRRTALPRASIVRLTVNKHLGCVMLSDSISTQGEGKDTVEVDHERARSSSGDLPKNMSETSGRSRQET